MGTDGRECGLNVRGSVTLDWEGLSLSGEPDDGSQQPTGKISEPREWMDTYFPASSVDFARESPQMLGVSCDQGDAITAFCEQSAAVRTRLRARTDDHQLGSDDAPTPGGKTGILNTRKQPVTRDKFIRLPVPFPIPAITAIAFFVVADIVLRWACERERSM